MGHIVNAVYVWGIAKAFGGSVVLRIEDHDRARCRPEYEQALLDDLDWLGLVPDVGTTGAFRAGPNEWRQSDNPGRYALALKLLESHSLVYACDCSRRDIARGAADDSGNELRYPGTCASANRDGATTLARRVRLSDRVENFTDLLLGAQQQRPVIQCGDLLVRDRLGQWTYQFSVVVDDAHHQVDVIIRGADLLESTGRQMQLARLLGREQFPLVMHHPLIRRPDGRKLSKSLGDTAVREMRRDGANAQHVLGKAAFVAGLIEHDGSISVDDLPELFHKTHAV